MNIKYNVKIFTRTCGLTWNGTPVSVRDIEIEGESIEDVMFRLLDEGALHRAIKIEITEPDISIVKKDDKFYI